VKEVAKEKGFSMGKLQRDADVANNTVKQMFKDPYYITITETLGKLAKALGVSPGELIEEVPYIVHDKYRRYDIFYIESCRLRNDSKLLTERASSF
jgi:lambda repressor-like predicted transcriptional regulator